MKYFKQTAYVDENGKILLETRVEIDSPELVDVLVEGLANTAAVALPKKKPGKPRPTKVSPNRGKGYESRRFAGHACCGAKGARHFKGCSKAPTPLEKEPATTHPPMRRQLSIDEFGSLHAAKVASGESFSCNRYALRNHLSPVEVQVAAKSGSFEDYLLKR